MSQIRNLKQQLLVEGLNDQHVIWASCQKFNLNQNFEVIECGGIDKLMSQIPVRLKASGIKTLGIVVDADQDLSARWSSLQNVFGKQIESLALNGWQTFVDDIKIGVWIMPNNELSGRIEDFIEFLIPESDALLPIAENILLELEAKALNQYAIPDHQKALIATWLAWQKVPGTPMGQAITRRYLSTESEICNVFIQWLTELFADNED